jgi:hypothetical protein
VTDRVVRIRQEPDAPVAAGIVGVVGGLVLAALVAGVALGTWWSLLFFLVWLVGGAAVGALSWGVTGLRFHDDRLVVVRPTGFRRSVRWDDVHYVRPDRVVDAGPALRGTWLIVGAAGDRQHVREVRLGIRLPDPGVDARTRSDLVRLRTRRAVLDELAARGFTLS